jgi:spermidine synthase
MSSRFQELAWHPTPMGEISLRRRRDPASGLDVYEVKLDDDYLMSSMFTAAEIEVARLALAILPGDGLEVAVGGLGLGYTAQTVLASRAVGSLIVVEALAEVIEWHNRGLVPVAADLMSDDRCRLVHGDFFAMATATSGLDPTQPGRRFDAVIVDIDHSPRHLLHPSHAEFYRPQGARRLADHLKTGGVFALWSNDPPDPEYQAVLADVFDNVAAHTVTFPNPLQDRPASNTVYLATRAPD